MGSNKYDYEYAVIGSGAAGQAAALMAGRSGKKVVLVEAEQLGGATTVTRDLPYGVALEFSQLYTEARQGARMGISSGNLHFNYPTVRNWRAGVVRRSVMEIRKELQAAGVKYAKGFAHFLEPNKLAVGTNGTLTAKKFLIATGAKPITTGISGLDAVKFLTPAQVLDLKKLPKVVMVIGGGASGCEAAEYLAELGVKVLVTELAERILPKEDPEVAEVMTKHFSKNLGIKILPGSRVVAVQNDRRATKVIFMNGGKEKSVRVEAVVLAAGTKPAVDLGLENAGVKYDLNGIKVNDAMQTSARHIYAAGDVAASALKVSSAEKASYEAAVAVANMLNRAKSPVDYRGFARVIHTYPRIASVGLTEDQCIQRDRKYRQAIVLAKEASVSKVDGFEDGFIKMIVAKKDGKILGATAVCPQAELVIQEIVLAMRTDLKLLDIATAPHTTMGWAELVKLVARRLTR